MEDKKGPQVTMEAKDFTRAAKTTTQIALENKVAKQTRKDKRRRSVGAGASTALPEGYRGVVVGAEVPQGPLTDVGREAIKGQWYEKTMAAPSRLDQLVQEAGLEEPEDEEPVESPKPRGKLIVKKRDASGGKKASLLGRLLGR